MTFFNYLQSELPKADSRIMSTVSLTQCIPNRILLPLKSLLSFLLFRSYDAILCGPNNTTTLGPCTSNRCMHFWYRSARCLRQSLRFSKCSRFMESEILRDTLCLTLPFVSVNNISIFSFVKQNTLSFYK